MFKVNDEKAELITVNEDQSEEVIATFLNEEILKDSKYNLYAYVEVIDGNLYIKFGEALAQTVFDRYKSTGHLANKRMIAVWESDKGDKCIHAKMQIHANNLKGYTWADRGILNTTEAYKIDNLKGFNAFMSDLNSEIAYSPILNKTSRNDYQSIIDVVDEIIAANQKNYILDLCARWGKTGTILRLCKELNRIEGTQIFLMCSYVKTVKHSYSEEIVKLTNNENCLFIDPDDYEEGEVANLINRWNKDPNHYVMYYVALTGDEESCFTRRTTPIKSIVNKNDFVMYIEEADFGAPCIKQISKIKKFADKNTCKKFIATTGTNAEKCEKFFN